MVILGLAVLLGLTLLLYWVEQQVPPPSVPPVVTPTIDPTPLNWPLFRDTFTHPKELATNANLRGLKDFNPFDSRSVADVSEKRARLDQRYQQALDAFDQGTTASLQNARQIAQEIVQEMPSHQAYQLVQLIDRIRTAQQMLQQGNVDEARRIAEEILKERPNPYARQLMQRISQQQP
jgi:hypothetical protein